MKLKSHTPKNTPVEHMMMFYRDFEEMANENFDGMIITGAPVENLEFEEVGYWDEIQKIFNWAHTHVTSTLYICWAAQAGLYYHYGIPKYPLPKKMFGVFRQHLSDVHYPISRGFDDYFNMPQSRHTEVRSEDIVKVDSLKIIAESPESGVSIVMGREGREFFITGHCEYDADTLKNEYLRDLAAGKNPHIPENYFPNDDASKEPIVSWRSHGTLMYTNWLNYFVYQTTPYNIGEITSTALK